MLWTVNNYSLSGTFINGYSIFSLDKRQRHKNTSCPVTVITLEAVFYDYDNTNDGIPTDDMPEKVFEKMECILDDTYTFDKKQHFMIHVNENADCGGTIDSSPYPWKLESNGYSF